MDQQASLTESDLERMLFDETTEPKPLPFSLLERITKGFSYKMEIGRGGFAVVYKGMLQNGAIAVKRLLNTYMHEKEFFREVECLMKVKHKNIVQLLGYCVDTQGNMTMYEGKYVMVDIQQRLLCFEYLPNGGLDGYIKDPSCGLEWTDRYDIIKGICEGLHHLHQINIVHLDLKPANILLDENMEPKITDFGISRSFEDGQTRVIPTKVVGTMGYMAPEFVINIVTKKYDLYSLGVVIMEILTGEKMYHGVDTVMTGEKMSHVVKNVLKSWSHRLNISRRMEECEQIQVCVEIGIKCTDFDPANRPVDMKEIIKRLAETERTEEISPRIKVLDIGITSSNRSLHSLDTDHSKQWIITGEDNGHVRIWSYQTQKKVDSFKLSDLSKVVCIKFIVRKQWFAAASGYYIHVYNYGTKMEKIKTMNAGSSDNSLHALAVHPTRPYLLSSDYGNIKVWNWDKNWECTHIYKAYNTGACIYQIALSSKATMASASDDCIVNVCSLDSPESNYTLYGHSASVKCLEFFTWDDNEYLVTGSDDQTSKIWDMQQKICLCTLKDFMSPVMFVLYRPDLEILITGSQDGSISLWRICSRIRRRPPKLEQTVNIGGVGVLALTCSMGRVVIAKKDALLILDIDCVISRKKSTDYSEPQLSGDTIQYGYKTSKVIAGSSEELPILDVSPLELGFSEPDESIICSLHLRNKTEGHVAFKVTDESLQSMQCSSEFPMYHIVPPRSTYTLVVKPGQNMKLEEEICFNVVLLSSTSGERYIAPFISQSECDEFFKEAEEMGNTVHEVTLEAIYAPQQDTVSKYSLNKGLLNAQYYHELHPLKHRFYPEFSDSIPSSLHLTNKTDEHVAFRLMKRSNNSLQWYSFDPLYGSVPPKTTCSFIMRTEEKKLAQQTGTDLVLQSSIAGDMLLADKFACDKFFDKAKESGSVVVYEVALKAIYTLQRGEPTCDPTFLEFNDGRASSMDASPAEPLIVTGHFNGKVNVWNHENKTRMGSFKISDTRVFSIKFHATLKLIMAMDGHGLIHVYDYACITQIQKIASFGNGRTCSFDIHPTKPYVVSASSLWDGHNGWKLKHRFETNSMHSLWDGHNGWKLKHHFDTNSMHSLSFNQYDPDCFVSATFNCLQVWNIHSCTPAYTMEGRSRWVNCFDFFKRGYRQYLITGWNDCTAKIWDFHAEECIQTLKIFMSPVIYVITIPGRPYIVTCSENATIHVLRSTDFSVKTAVNFTGGGDVKGLVCLMGSRRIAICQEEVITILDINEDEEEVGK